MLCIWCTHSLYTNHYFSIINKYGILGKLTIQHRKLSWESKYCLFIKLQSIFIIKQLTQTQSNKNGKILDLKFQDI